jgi:hypothetical protein
LVHEFGFDRAKTDSIGALSHGALAKFLMTGLLASGFLKIERSSQRDIEGRTPGEAANIVPRQLRPGCSHQKRGSQHPVPSQIKSEHCGIRRELASDASENPVALTRGQQRIRHSLAETLDAHAL